MWNQNYVTDSKHIESVQRRITRNCPALRNLSYTDRLDMLSLPTLEFRRERGDMIQIYKCFNDNNKYLFTPFFVQSTTSTRSHGRKLTLPCVNLEIGRRAFYFRTLVKWNNLPENCVKASTVNNFKNIYDSLYFTSLYDHFYYIE